MAGQRMYLMSAWQLRPSCSPRAGSWAGHVPAGTGMPGIGSPVGGILDSGPDALVGHGLVVEPRDDMQVRMETALVVPAERVAIGREPPMQLGSDQEQKVPCGCPLVRCEVEDGSPVRLRGDAAAARHDVGRVAGVSGRGADAEVVLEVHVRLAQPVVIAEDAVLGHRTVLLVRTGM